MKVEKKNWKKYLNHFNVSTVLDFKKLVTAHSCNSF